MLPAFVSHVPADSLPAQPKRPRAAGSYWAGVPFPALLRSIEKKCRECRMRPGRWTVYTFRDGADMVASAPIPGAGEFVRGYEVTPHLGLAISNVGRRTFAMFVGVVHNRTGGAVILDRIYSPKKHTVGADWEKILVAMFVDVRDAIRRMPDQIRDLRNRRLDTAAITQFLHAAGRASPGNGRGSLMPWSRIGRVEDHMTATGGKTAWDLLISFGVISDLNSPILHMDRLYAFNRIVRGASPVTLSNIPM